MDELKKEFEALAGTVEEMAATIDLPGARKKIEVLSEQTMQPDFWANEEEARKISLQLSDEQRVVTAIDTLLAEIEEAAALAEMAGEADPAMEKELQKTLMRLKKRVKLFEVETFMNGPYDKGDAIVAIHAGQGGTEACDWAAMLSRMYSRYFEKKGYNFVTLDESAGDEAGIKAVTYLVRGRNAYGYLKGEAGTHRLVRQSPFNADNLRQTSFALVEVLPYMAETTEVEVRDDEVEWSFYRSGGKGGQNVNKVSTAVRLRHIPTGIVVEAQTERYQEQNRKYAMAILKAKLWAREEEKRKQELAAVKGTKMASWGSQIRNYVLHPYHLVKDVRTGVETSDTEAVLDGDLDAFVEAELLIS